MANKKDKGKKGGKKIGRSMRSPSHQRYNLYGMHEKNKARKLTKHIKKHPKDRIALKAINNLRKAA